MRRAKVSAKRKLEIGSFTMDSDEHTAALNGEEIPMTVREFNILYKLLSYPKKTFTRRQLMDEFWDADSDTAPRADFISNLSHEMKAPLAVIQNYGTLLQAPKFSNEKRLEYAKGVTDGAHRLSDMMSNILKLSRLENQQAFPHAECFDPGEQLCEALLQYESLWERENIEIETDIADSVTVCTDRELLFLVWNNLLSNAFKFTPSGGRISLSLRRSDQFAIVSVRDSGCGMSAETGAHIFEKFYQGDSSRATQGNGLSLAPVKRAMDILHAEISVESTLGEGSVFTVRIRRFQ